MLKWIDHPSYRRDEQLMLVLHECGMATFEQLQIITGWSERNLREQIKRLKRRGREESGGNPGDDDLWIVSHRLTRPYGKSQVAYALGRDSLRYVHEIREEENKKIKAPPFGQVQHFIGTNQVLVRCLQAFGREKLYWWSTQHVTDLLLLSQKKQGDRRDLIRPDALIRVGENRYYIEFDNDTEMPRQLERKFHRYVQTLQSKKETTPILWITTNPKRQDYLRRNWEAVKRISYVGQPVPDMHFFVQGDELELLMSNGT